MISKKCNLVSTYETHEHIICHHCGETNARKHREKQRDPFFACVDLEKAYYRESRQLLTGEKKQRLKDLPD